MLTLVISCDTHCQEIDIQALETHCPWTKFGIKRIDWENLKRSFFFRSRCKLLFGEKWKKNLWRHCNLKISQYQYFNIVSLRNKVFKVSKQNCAILILQCWLKRKHLVYRSLYVMMYTKTWLQFWKNTDIYIYHTSVMKKVRITWSYNPENI